MKDMDQAELQRILGDKKALRQIAGSADAQALAQMLQRGQSQASLKHIAERAAKGDTSQLKDLISTITSSPGGAEPRGQSFFFSLPFLLYTKEKEGSPKGGGRRE